MIVKVQVPLVTSEVVPAILVYNEDRSTEFQTALTNEIAAFMKGRAKAFFHVKYNATKGALEITGEAPWQKW